ncbi:esterase [Xanthobacter autotrophicus DSM 597]|uniref:alpha/beta hydrolase n=1 Tax=Xanthobacter wiegelii TaxID=3119913 RepID=UPI00372C25F2
MLDPHLAGHITFAPAAQDRAHDLPPLPPGHHNLGLSAERDALLVVPEGLEPGVPVPLMVLFHGGGGSAQKILPMMEQHALTHRFLLLVPQSVFPTWDIVIAGNGPDRERLETALALVARHFEIDRTRICFAGHSDGGSYTLSLGLTNGHFVTHLIVSSAGFMSVQRQSGAPRVFISHGVNDEQIPVQRSGRAHTALLKEAGYDVTYMEYNGPHAWQPPVVGLAVSFFLEPAAAPAAP